jgi:DNA-binding protein YbaB
VVIMAGKDGVFVSPDGQQSELDELERDMRKLRTALTDVRATGESADGYVVATVGGRGELLELSLDPRIYRTQDSDALADDILAAVRAAAERAGEQVFTAARKLLDPTATRDSADLDFGPFLRQVEQLKGRS